MKKAFIALIFTGIMFLVTGHPFVTNGASVLGDNETKVELSVGTDFVKEWYRDVGFNVNYGIGDRFQIGMASAWYANKNESSDQGFVTPDLSMILLIRPDFVAIKAYSIFNAEEFGSQLLYTVKPKKIQTNFNLDLGFVSDGAQANAFTWAYSIIQPINDLFLGAEIYGKYAGWMEKDAKKLHWQVGLGHKVFSRKTHTVSLGLGGSFVSKDDLYITLAMIYSGKVLGAGKE
jgi:hypothetical protein